MRRGRIVCSVVFFLFALCACNSTPEIDEDSDSEALEAVVYTYDLFTTHYYWYTELPVLSSGDLSGFSDPSELVNELRFENDRNWSFVMNRSEFIELYSSGTSTGWGAGFSINDLSQLVLTYVHEDSPIGRVGAQRGWVVSKLNDTDLSADFIASENGISEINSILASESAVFGFVDFDETVVDATVSAGVVVQKTVMHTEIFDLQGKKTAYLVFDSFLSSSISELSDAFSSFQSEGVSNVILDLRYNGGGSLLTTSYLVGLLVGKSYDGQVYAQLQYNDKNEENNRGFLIRQQDLSLDLEKLLVLTTERTASASEVLINGLRPYLLDNLQVVGEVSHGKPVGMDVYHSVENDIVVAPVSFLNSNSENNSDYFDGLVPDVFVIDNVQFPWGDTRDALYSTALQILGGEAISSTEYLKQQASTSSYFFDERTEAQRSSVFVTQQP